MHRHLVFENHEGDRLLKYILDMLGEVSKLKKMVEEFEQRYSEAQKNTARLKEAEESFMRMSQLQETIKR